MATSDKDRIMALLKSAGSRGSTTWELITETHCSAAARRVWDLQQDGYQIEKRKEGKGVYRWIYRGEPLPPQQLDLPLTGESHVDRDSARPIRLVEVPPLL